MDRINLSAQGFCKIENLHFDWETSKGNTVDAGYKNTGYKNISDMRTSFWETDSFLYVYIESIPVIRTSNNIGYKNNVGYKNMGLLICRRDFFHINITRNPQ